MDDVDWVAYNKSDARHLSGLGLIGLVFYHLRLARFYKDGCSTSWVWNYWNPLTYIAIMATMLVALFWIGVGGIAEEKDNLGFTVNPYWKDKEIEWIKYKKLLDYFW